MGSGGECGRRFERPCERANNDYEEHGIIGKGAYGIVYLVTHLPTNKQADFSIRGLFELLR
ncbi:unnamed protein product [Toxocara canis]|uniref:Protein kinase domain-containing protein n=1 Tax=Toxocara canis TaxID=6265 RepID=A0A183U570_TOXCA|nr:unnamed protein product [Toxocara canis]